MKKALINIIDKQNRYFASKTGVAKAVINVFGFMLGTIVTLTLGPPFHVSWVLCKSCRFIFNSVSSRKENHDPRRVVPDDSSVGTESVST